MNKPTTSSVKTKRSRIENADLVRVYGETQSIWKTGKILGIAGQKVHERLRSMGVTMTGHTSWTDEELDELRVLVANNVSITEMAHRLDRTYAAVACKLHEIGITNYRRVQQKRVKAGTGYDKSSIKKHLTALLADSDLRITPYARRHGLNVDSLVNALQRHFPSEMAQYLVAHHGDITRKECPGCGATFIPASGKQLYCTRKCASDYMRDQEYFGGKRMTAMGMRERTCQLCGKQNPKIIHAHHLIGKVNDQDNRHMVALCAGCHRIVGAAARISGLVDNPAAWRKLIWFTHLEAHGANYAGLDVLPDPGE